jgi:PAS domain S-box-containing protein/diguanylate cyclase (GGDEF)-like protein
MSAPLDPESYRSILESLPSAVYLVDRDRRILLWNSGAEKLTGYLRQEVVGRLCWDDFLMHCDENQACLCGTACPLQQTIHDGKLREADLFLRHKDGQRVPVRVSAVPFRDEHGSILGAVECFEKRQMLPVADPHLQEMSLHATADLLTGLADHAATQARLHAYLEDFAVSAIPFAVLSISVDALDKVRHKDGRNAVNKVLYATARTIESTLGPNDMIGRWSEERFLAVLAGCTAPALLRAAKTIKRLVNLEGIPWWGQRLQVTLSIGGAIVQAGDTWETLAARAEAALESNSRLEDPAAVA